MAQAARKDAPPELESAEPLPPVPKSLLQIALGIIAIKLGGDFVVGGDVTLLGHGIAYGAVAIARFFGMSETLIGLTIVAMGTSLPELAVSVTASLSGNNSLAISNVVGSNLFNLMVVLGASAVMNPIVVGKAEKEENSVLQHVKFGSTGKDFSLSTRFEY